MHDNCEQFLAGMNALPVGRPVAVVAVLRGLAVSAGGSLAPCRGGSSGASRVPVKRNTIDSRWVNNS